MPTFPADEKLIQQAEALQGRLDTFPIASLTVTPPTGGFGTTAPSPPLSDLVPLTGSTDPQYAGEQAALSACNTATQGAYNTWVTKTSDAINEAQMGIDALRSAAQAKIDAAGAEANAAIQAAATVCQKAIDDLVKADLP